MYKRQLWGSDWPHPNIKGPVPDDGQLLDFVLQVCDSRALQQAVLIDNPRRLYA